MRKQIGWFYIVLVSLLITACTSDPFKAPCDEYASFCGAKTKINQW